MNAIRRAMSLPLLCRDDQNIHTPGGAQPHRRVVVRRVKTNKPKGLIPNGKRCSRIGSKLSRSSSNKIHPSIKETDGNHGENSNQDVSGDRDNNHAEKFASTSTLDTENLKCSDIEQSFNCVVRNDKDLHHTLFDANYNCMISLNTGSSVISSESRHDNNEHDAHRDNGTVNEGGLQDADTIENDLSFSEEEEEVDSIAELPQSPLPMKQQDVGPPITTQPLSITITEQTGSSVDLMSLCDTIISPDSENNGPPVTMATSNMVDGAPTTDEQTDMLSNEADAKKRPLSVSSTSSSSSSSLPRQPRKKVAAGSTIEEWGDDPHGNNHNNHPSNCVNGVHSNSHSKHSRDSSIHSNKELHGPSKSEIVNSGATLLEKVVAEILETERKYVEDMKDIIRGYLQFTMDRRHTLGIPDEDIKALFGNITDIFMFNSGFLSVLEQCSADAIQVAQCFVEKGQGFLIYADYCTNYPRAVEILTKCMRDPHIADAFKHQQMALQHGLPLGSYLLKPVQRILKYHLLLQNMLNNYEPTRPGQHMIQMALLSMTKMADTINEMKRKHERMVHVQELQSLLYGWEGDDLTTYGDLVREDTFRMYGAKAQRHLYLFEKALFIAKKKEDGTLAAKDSIQCSNLMLIESIPREPLSFHVIPFDNPRLQYTVQAKSLEQKRQWCQDLKRLILENYSAAIPEKAKELVMMLGKSREEEDLESNQSENPEPGRRGQHNAPEYLERRKGRRKSTSLIPDFGLLKTKKGMRKSDSSSPNSSPRLRRRSDISGFSSQVNKSPNKSHLDDSLCEESHLEAEQEEADMLAKVRSVPLREHAGKNRMCRSQSRSLESLKEAYQFCNGSNPADPDTKESKSFDDTSTRAKRLSQVIDEAGLSVLKESEDLDPSILSSVLSVPSVQKVENSKNKAVNRVDSVMVTKMRKQYLKQVSSAPALPSYDPSSPDLMSYLRSKQSIAEHMDDGYVNVAFNAGDGYTMQEECQDPDYSNMIRVNCDPDPLNISFDENYGDYVRLDLTATIPKSPNRLPDVVPSVTLEHCEIDNDDKFDQNYPISPPSPSISSSYTNGADAFMSSSLETVKSNTSMNERRRNHSPNVSHGASIPCQKDPWVPRPPDAMNSECFLSPESYLDSCPSTPRMISKNGDLINDRSIQRCQAGRKLLKSKSFNSTEDLKKDCISEEDIYVRGHRRQVSDTLVFTNRQAFIASAHSSGIRPDWELQRRIARLATPPRELGPDDLIREIELSKERGRVVARYATPPREAMDPAMILKYGIMPSTSGINMDHQGLSCSVGYSNMSMPPCLLSPGSASVSRNSSLNPNLPIRPSSATSCDFSRQRRWGEYSSTPTSPTRLIPQRSGSFHGTSVHSCNKPHLFAPSHSPSSPTSSESIVDSLRNVMQNITSRLTRRNHGITNSKSVESSPIRTPRARSAEDMFRVDRSRTPDSRTRTSDSRDRTPDSRNSSKAGKDKEKKKDRKNRSVFQLARTYSERVKGKTRPLFHRQDSVVKQELKELLRENKQGSLTLGERIATSKPVVLGTYTLPRHRPPRPKRKNTYDVTNSTDTCTDQHTDMILDTDTKHHDSGCDSRPNSDIHPTIGVPSEHPEVDCDDSFSDIFNLLKVPSDTLDNSESENGDDCTSEFFYENRFVEDLEGSLNASLSSRDTLRDSAVYSDDGAMSYVDTDTTNALPSTIKDTVKMIENRAKSKHVPRIEIKQAEKAQGIQDILKNLEAATGSGSLPGSPLVSPEEQLPLKTVRERTRELVECATLTRIRQNSYSIADEHYLTPDEELSPTEIIRKGVREARPS